MKQIEATPERPFYSVAYQYENNPWALYSCNSLVGTEDTTMQGTDSYRQAKLTADRYAAKPGIALAIVSKSEDCYNHKTVYVVFSATTKVNKEAWEKCLTQF